jgi:iron complex outermembrane receptor protein
VSVNYQATENLLLYLAHRRGYLAGGFTLDPAAVATAAYTPEYVDDVELGAKSDFHIGDMPGRLNGAVYYQKYRDIQHLTNFNSADQLVAGLVNVAKAHIYGGELELTVKPIPAVEVSAAYAHVKAQYDDWTDIYQSPLSGMFYKLDVSDSDFPFVPVNQWNVGARYSVPIPDQYGGLSMAATWYGQSSMNAADNSTSNCGPDGFYVACHNRGFRIPGHNLVNLRADWKNVAGKRFDLSFFVNNLSNTVYQNTALGLAGVLGTYSVGYGPPRMYGLALRVPFGRGAH